MVVPGIRVGLALCCFFASMGCPSWWGEEVAQSLGAELSLNVAIPCKVFPCGFIPGTVLIWMLLSVCGWLGFFYIYLYIYGLSQFFYASPASSEHTHTHPAPAWSKNPTVPLFPFPLLRGCGSRGVSSALVPGSDL